MHAYHYFPAEDVAALAPLFIFYGVLIFVCGLSWVINYIVRGIGVYTLAKKQNLPAPFMAWIPYVRTYLNGQLTGDIVFGKKTIKRPGLWLLFLPMAASLLLGIVMLVYFVSLIITAFSASALPESQMAAALLPVLLIWIVIIMIISIASSVVTSWITVLVHFNIYKKYRADNTALTHALFSAFVPFYRSFYLFILSKKVSAAEDEPYIPPILPDQE